MKKVLGFVAVLLVVLVVVLVVLASQAGGIIKTAVEELGPDITGTTVSLQDVNVSLLGGNAGIKGFVLGNPKGFKSDSLIEVGEVDVALDLQSLSSDTVRIKRIIIDGAELTYELSTKGSNVAALQKNIERNTASTDQAPAEEETEANADAESETKLVIDQVLIKGTKINLAASLLQGEGASLVVPDIELNDIGKDSGGASPADVAKEIFGVLNQAVGKSIGKVLSKDQIKAALDNEVTKQLGDAKDKLGDKLGKGLNSLFGKPKEK